MTFSQTVPVVVFSHTPAVHCPPDGSGGVPGVVVVVVVVGGGGGGARGGGGKGGRGENEKGRRKIAVRRRLGAERGSKMPDLVP